MTKKDWESKWQFHRHLAKTHTRLPTWPTWIRPKICRLSSSQSQRWERQRTRSQPRRGRMKSPKTTLGTSTRASLKITLKISAQVQLLEQLKKLRSKIKRREQLQETIQVSFILWGAHHKHLSLCRDYPNTNRLGRAPRLLLLLYLPKNYQRNLQQHRKDKLCATHLEAYSQSQLYLEMISAERGHHYRANNKLRPPNPLIWL